jgi:hypothetical protein
MYRRSTTTGRYVPARSTSPSSSRKRSTPYALDVAIVWASTPAAPLFALTRFHASARTSLLAMRSYNAWKRAPGAAWLRHTVGVAVVALCPRARALGVVGTGLAGHALALTCSADTTTAGVLPSRRVVLRGVRSRGSRPGTTDPLGLPLRSVDFALAYTTRLAPTRAAQTGLSCSALLLARVLRPLPRRDRRRASEQASSVLPSP